MPKLTEQAINYALGNPTGDGKSGQVGTNETDIASLGLGDLSGVTLSSPSNNQVLQYNGTNWINATTSGGVSDLSDLGDTNVSSPSASQVLQYVGSKWTNQALSFSIADASDTNIASSPSASQVIQYQGGKWKSQALNFPITGLNDVTTSNDAKGDVLKYDGSKFVNKAVVESYTKAQVLATAFLSDAGNEGQVFLVSDQADTDCIGYVRNGKFYTFTGTQLTS